MDMKALIEAALWETCLGPTFDLTKVKKGSANVIYGDGRYVYRQNLIGQFFARMDGVTVPGLPPAPGPFFKFALPKIPKEILMQQISFYRKIMNTMSEAEAASLVFYDLQEKRYFVHVPFQVAVKSRVRFEEPDLREKYPADRYLEVLNGHSHNTMIGRFSAVDDADEKQDQLYMVIGSLKSPQLSFSIRACLMEKKIEDVPFSDIFDITEEELQAQWSAWENLHPTEWEAKVKPMVSDLKAEFIHEGKKYSLSFDHSRWRKAWPEYSEPGEQLRFGFGASPYRARGKHFGGEARLLASTSKKVRETLQGFLREMLTPDFRLESDLFLLLLSLHRIDDPAISVAFDDFAEEVYFTPSGSYTDYLGDYSEHVVDPLEDVKSWDGQREDLLRFLEKDPDLPFGKY